MMEPTWQTTDGSVRLYLGDCLEVLPTLDADVVITDPPYGMALDTDYSGIDRGRGKEYDRVIGDDEPFDPGFLLPLAKVHGYSISAGVAETVDAPRSGLMDER